MILKFILHLINVRQPIMASIYLSNENYISCIYFNILSLLIGFILDINAGWQLLTPLQRSRSRTDLIRDIIPNIKVFICYLKTIEMNAKNSYLMSQPIVTFN